MKRKASLVEWPTDYTTDSGTSYGSAQKGSVRRYQRKRMKHKQMYDYYAYGGPGDYKEDAPAAYDLLRVDRIEKRKMRHDARDSRKRVRIVSSDEWETSEPHSPLVALSNAAVAAQEGSLVAGVAGLAIGGPAVGDAAATVGGIAGAAASLYNGWSSLYSSQNKKMRSVVNRRVDKSAMKISGKANVKHVKKIRVSPYLKKAVKQVMKGASATGSYYRQITGLVGVSYFDKAAPYEDKQVTSSIMGTTQIGAYVPSCGSRSVGNKTFFNTLCDKTINGNDFNIRSNHDLNFFTPFKLWHAASVLFNHKVEHENPYNTTDGNLSTVYIDNTGLPADTTPANLKIEVTKSYVTFNLKNLSARNVFVDIYECVPTERHNVNNPLVDLVNTSMNIQDGTNVDTTVQLFEIDGENTTTEKLLFFTSGVVDGVAICKNNGWKWKYEKKTMLLSPGENCQHIMSGPSGVFDFQNKCYDAASTLFITKCASANWSKHVMIACRADPTLRDPATQVNAGLRYNPTTANKYELYSPVAVEATEVMHIKVPEVAGFLRQTALPATTVGQPLNFRKKKIHISSITAGVAGGIAGLVANSEFNPVATQSTQGLL